MKSRNVSLLVIVAVFVGVVAGLIISSNLNLPPASNAADETTLTAIPLGDPTPVSQELVGLENLSKAFVQVVKDVNPAVVTIKSAKVVKRQSHPFFNDPTFRRFFQVPEDDGEDVRQGLGSGVIVSSEGYILTNNHVVEGADELHVDFNDDEYEAEVVGRDPESDVAVIKIDKKGLPAVKLGNSDNLEVGEWVLAVGNPFSSDLQKTVTAGIVSAKGRSNMMQGHGITYADFIQTDAAINPGNSGGPLVNLRGELVGINTAIIGQANVGIGFAIPINLAKNVMEQLIDHGKVERGFLGLRPAPMDDDLADALGLEKATGALVDELTKDAPAEKAGIKLNDVVLKINDIKIKDDDHLRKVTASFPPDTKVKVTLWRDGKEKVVTVELGDREEYLKGVTGDDEVAEVKENKLGIEVDDLTDYSRQQLRLDDDEVGVVVSSIKRGSVASKKGMREGDLITSVNREPVSSEREFNKMISDLEPDDVVMFRIKRGSVSRLIALRVPADKE